MKIKKEVWIKAMIFVAIALLTLSLVYAEEQNISVRVSNGNDDAEEWLTGSPGYVKLDSSDLELPYDPSDEPQLTGMRFRNIGIPQNATITYAHVQFTGEPSPGSGSPSLMIFGEDADNATIFSSTTYNITNRIMTSASVSWDPPSWSSGSAGANERTPTISSIIQEIVNRPGWNSGNSLVILINGTGDASNYRRAESYEGLPADAPLLVVNYTTTDTTPPATITNLNNQSAGYTWIYWNWTNPSDADFNSSIIYIDGSNVANTSNNFYNATGLNQGTSYTITVHTKDNNSNINVTDVNSTASTISNDPPNISSLTLTTTDPTTNSTDENLTSSVSATDTEGDNISYIYNWYKNDTLNATTFIENGLRYYYPFNNDTLDYYGDNNGTIVGNTQLTADGNIGGAYSFDGDGDYISGDISDDSWAAKDFTISAWVKIPTLTHTNNKLIVARHQSTVQKNFQVGIEDDNRWMFSTYASCTGVVNTIYSTETLSTNTWYHVVYVLDSGTRKYIYVNGEQLVNGTTYVTIPSGCAQKTIIGANLRNVNTAWNGTIDEVLIFNRTLSEAEIKLLYEGGKYGGNIMNASQTTQGDEWKLGVKAGDYLAWSAETNSSAVTIQSACTPNITNTSWNSWLNLSCLTNDKMNQSRNLTQYDANNCGAANQTFIEYRATEDCDYCTPSMVNTSWTEWTNVSCLANSTMNITRNRTQYDSNNCGEVSNTTFIEYSSNGTCNYAAPIVSTPSITPPTAYTTNDLNCSFTVTDGDTGDTLTVNYTWYNGTTEKITGNMNVTNGTQSSIILTNTNTTKSETWNCSVIPYDETVYGTEKSTTKTIQNSLPTSPIVDILPAVPNDDNDLAASITTASTDLDSDTITYSYQWYKNDVSQAGQTSSTLSNLLTSPGETWKVEVTPNDGTDDGTTANDNVTINGTIATTYAVNLISPSSGSTWTSSNTVTFEYNTTLNATNCSLIIDSAVDQTDTNITPNATETFTKTLSNADYTWSVNCTDINNITNSSASWSLSVSYSSGSSSSGGGGGGGSTSYDCNDNQDNDGDGLTDYPNDPGCSSRYDNDESNAEEESTECSELWSCSNWGKCTDNMQQRLCLDANECGTEEFKSPETRECGEQAAEESAEESTQANTTKEEIQKIKENQLKEYNFEGKELQKFSFVYKGKTHYITIKEIREKSVLIVITSDPIQETLELQKPSTIDIDNDGSADIRIILKSIKDNKADITMRIIGSGISSVTGDAIKVLPYKRPSPYYSIPTILLLIIFIVLISVRKTHISSKKKKYITILHFVLMGLILLLFVSSIMKNFPVVGAFLTDSTSNTDDTPNKIAFPMTLLAFIIAVSSVILMVIERRRIQRFIEHGESHKTKLIPKNQPKNKIINKLKKAYKL
ncbi:hypothetical protein KY342_05745 [Candidatus Woesearchaeota archaeon]|nr:hypothetical protein [Candidatus Woesearchaeota archaeon]